MLVENTGTSRSAKPQSSTTRPVVAIELHASESRTAWQWIAGHEHAGHFTHQFVEPRGCDRAADEQTDQTALPDSRQHRRMVELVQVPIPLAPEPGRFGQPAHVVRSPQSRTSSPRRIPRRGDARASPCRPACRGDRSSARGASMQQGRPTLRSADRHDLMNGEQTPAQRVNTKVSSNGRPRDASDSRDLRTDGRRQLDVGHWSVEQPLFVGRRTAWIEGLRRCRARATTSAAGSNASLTPKTL